MIDILRATSSIIYGIDNGAEAIIPVAQVEDCLAYTDKGYLLLQNEMEKWLQVMISEILLFPIPKKRLAEKQLY